MVSPVIPFLVGETLILFDTGFPGDPPYVCTMRQFGALDMESPNDRNTAPVFRFFWLITASDFVSLLLTTSRLLRRPSLVFLVLNQNKLQNSFVSFPHCRVRLRIVGRSLPGGNSLSPHLSSLHCEKTNFKTVSFKELPFKRGFSERDCKGR